jgi:hypothetical protein
MCFVVATRKNNGQLASHKKKTDRPIIIPKTMHRYAYSPTKFHSDRFGNGTTGPSSVMSPHGTFFPSIIIVCEDAPKTMTNILFVA